MVVLLHAGVFKRNIQGIQAFNKFVATFIILIIMPSINFIDGIYLIKENIWKI